MHPLKIVMVSQKTTLVADLAINNTRLSSCAFGKWSWSKFEIDAMVWQTVLKKTFYATTSKAIEIYIETWTNNVHLSSLPT